MIVNAGSNVVGLLSIRGPRETADRINGESLMRNIVAAFASHNIALTVGPTMSRAYAIDLSFPLSGREWQVIVKFNTRNAINTSDCDDWIAYAWNQTIGEGRRIPTDDPAHAGALFAKCSAWNTRQQSAGGLLGALTSIVGSDPNYTLLCSQYSVVPNLQAATIGPSGIVDRLVGNPIVAASDNSLIGTDPTRSTDVAGLAREGLSGAAASINSALGASDGEGMGTNDLKFFAYATLGIIGVVVLVKVVKEVKGI